MPAPEPSPPQPSPPAAGSHSGAYVLAEAAARARDIRAALGGGRSPAPSLPAPPPADARTDVPATDALPAEAPTAGAGLGRILRGPSGLGTVGLHLARCESASAPVEPPAAPAEGTPVPGLYHHPVPEPDPVRVEEVSRRIKTWALDEVDLYPEDWEDQFDGFSVGRYMVACHPDAPTVDHLLLATRLMVAENAVDDCYCEDHGGSPIGLGGRLLLAHTALDPLYTTKEYQPRWAESLHSDAPRRAYRSAMEYFVRAAGASQADRYRHDMARLHLGYLAEAAWAQTDHVPEVWEYLAMRQFNNFRPCPTITDTVGGYELPADLHATPAMQRVIALAGNATTIVNDLYSYTKELASPGHHLNLPVVIAEREGISDREAYLKSVEVHNDLMHDFEAAAADLAAACPVPNVQRFLRGVAAWVDGNHYWHRTNTYRYSLPDFW
ncbi:family 2 encapsulin nanocompartment cargo protein terpene cyclase [Streptomyces antimycoticus]|uniref:Terpene synthase n=2 Tax=Streptomyces violaceusniger group TaxID=2839105 RepID=A0ABD5JBM0_9ACTN|nr:MULTISPECIES: family 2 encapsulin nanocompartment cargo protein terpene cyclase [Streptomyces]KUL62606.1 2-methylisoborneol synthase [Streptomyces violaceusniger]MEE4585772.1 family 2 encapsulin nanocompartment cargo protein terpene cyclase [Streptomyces sp. DSM 41602]WJE01189.1 family 2 encapsulin nanocompartment cargo protein terpene cyclase [Streptomyces antimycoticus]